MATRKPALFFALLLSAVLSCHAILPEATPPTAQTLGQPWPMPQSHQTSSEVQSLDKFSFSFNVVGQDCDILRDALNRYFKIIFYAPNDSRLKFKPFSARNEVLTNWLQAVDVNVLQPCEKIPHLGMDESYDLVVSMGSGKLSSKSIWGALRGLETLSQIIYEDDDGGLKVNSTTVHDFPRFSWRGVLLDTSRHYLPVDILKQNLEAMAYNKLNVFHWHIVDDQSFPYQSRTFPGLSEKGAYDPFTHVYTQENIAEIIEFARIRGIRVVPEFDSPGHSQSWGKSQMALLTKCYSKGKPDGTSGPIDPTLNTTYTFLKAFMKELSEVFPDNYLHLGGDEVSFNCWKSNPLITQFMKKMGYAANYSLLEEYYMQNLLDIVASFNKGYIIWQEVVDNGAKIKSDAVVEVWRGNNVAKEMSKITALGYRTILSSCWYLNRITMGPDWKKSYTCEPQAFNGTKAQKDLVVGGEMCFWGEYIDGTNLIARAWPRGGAVAERLWSREDMKNPDLAMPRLEEQRCRMVKRGLNAEPVDGPSFCKYEYN